MSQNLRQKYLINAELTNKLEKYAFAHNSTYYIGFEQSAIKQRERDRIGEAIDISFQDSGLICSAEYTNHTGWDTHNILSYKDGLFYYNDIICEDSNAAMQQYLKCKK